MNTEALSEGEKNKISFAEVWLKQTNKRIDTFYDYSIPFHLDRKVKPGVRVVVPFGKGNRALEGFVSAVKLNSSFSEKMREILAVIDDEPVLTHPQIALCDWMHRYYCSLYYEALTPFVAPVRVIAKKSRKSKDSADFGYEAYHPRRKTEKKAIISKKKAFLSSQRDDGHGGMDLKEISTGFLMADRSLFFQWDNLEKRFHLYAQMAEEVMISGGQSVILFPDVFSAGLFSEKMADTMDQRWAYCSGDIKRTKRYDVFYGVRTGQIRVVFGTRAALFLPFTDLKAIMIDEPDDSGYFARSMPKYDTIEVAKTYARLLGSKLIMGGSEYPLNLYEKIRKSEMAYHRFKDRISPTLEIIDMQSELRRGNLDFISNTLKNRMETTIEAHQKVLLMLNRRGYAGYFLCRNCGHVERCPNCGITMKPCGDGQVHCPYCGHSKRMSSQCPACGSHRFKPVGLGVEKAGEILQKRYPAWRILQIDARHFSNEAFFEQIKNQINVGEWDVVIGTRALMKGLSYKDVGLTAVLLMDEAFNHGDYNDSEKACLLYRRFFHLSEKDAIGQTYEPENEVIHGLMDEWTEDFLESEWQYRKLMHYPPACHLVVISIIEKNHAVVKTDSRTLFLDLKKQPSERSSDEFFQIFEPVLAGIQPGTGDIRYKIMIKTSRIDTFHQKIEGIIQAGDIEKLRSRVSIDIDPVETI